MEFEEEFSEEAFLAESIQDLTLRLDLHFESPNWDKKQQSQAHSDQCKIPPDL